MLAALIEAVATKEAGEPISVPLQGGGAAQSFSASGLAVENRSSDLADEGVGDILVDDGSSHGASFQAAHDDPTRVAGSTQRSGRKHFNALLEPLPRQRLHLCPPQRLQVEHSKDDRCSAASSIQQVEVENTANTSSGTLTDGRDLFKQHGSFETRKLLALQQMSHGSSASVTAKELRVLRFLASADHGDDRPDILCSVETKNFRLAWLLDPAKQLPTYQNEPTTEQKSIGGRTSPSPTGGSIERSSRKQSSQPCTLLNLLNMPTDVFVQARGRPSPEDLHRPLLSSPRSVLVCIRNGVQPLDLQEKPLDQLVLEWSARGYTKEMIVQRHAFQETLRQHQLAALQEEYALLCQKIAFDDVCAFFEFLALDDGMQAPDLVEVQRSDGTTKLEVRVSGDATVVEAIHKIEEKAAHDRSVVTAILRQEISNAKKKADTFAFEQERNTAKELAHRRELQQRAVERQQLMASKQAEADAKAKRRAQLVDAALQRRIDEAAFRQARAEQMEQQSTAAISHRQEQRRERQRQKQEAQLLRLQQAEEKLLLIEDQRRERFQEKEALRDALMNQKRYLQEKKKAADALANAELQERRQDIAKRAAALGKEKQSRAQHKQELVDRRLTQFAAEKEMERDFKHLVELRKELNREEVFAESERKRQQVVDSILERRAVHELSFCEFQEKQAKTRRDAQEQDLQLLLIKELQQSRHTQHRQYELLLAAEECTRKAAKAEQLEEARTVEKTVLEAERESMQQTRKASLSQFKDEMVRSERQQYFKVLNATDPGDSVLLKERNARSIAVMKKTLGKRLTDADAAALCYKNFSSTNPEITSSPSPQPDISAIRPSTSLR